MGFGLHHQTGTGPAATKVVNFNIPLKFGHPMDFSAFSDEPKDTPIEFRVHYNGVLVEDGRARIVHNASTPNGGMNLRIDADGYKPWSGRYLLRDGSNEAASDAAGLVPLVIELEPSDAPFLFPCPTNRAPTPPFDADDPPPDNNKVHHTLPDEWFTQAGTRPVAANKLLVRGDAWGFRTSFVPDHVVDPLGNGSNTTPPDMWMTYQLELYPVDQQEKFLAEYSRYYTHILFTRPWNRSNFLAMCTRAKRYGLWICYADTDRSSIQFVVDNNIPDFLIIGLECDSYIPRVPGPGGLDDLIMFVCGKRRPDGVSMECGIHFTSSGGPHDRPNNLRYAFPIPPQSYTDWWKQNYQLGLRWLFHQTYQNAAEEDSAGKMGAIIFYARQCLADAAGEGLKLVACENMSMRNLYGFCDTGRSNLRGLELVSCPTNGYPGMGPIAGSFNGLQAADGSIA